jgi:hypothetical protein
MPCSLFCHSDEYQNLRVLADAELPQHVSLKMICHPESIYLCFKQINLVECCHSVYPAVLFAGGSQKTILDSRVPENDPPKSFSGMQKKSKC